MKCPLCNAEIKEGSLYCEKCGEDIHIVPDYDPVIEDANQTIESISQDIFTENKEIKKKESETTEKSDRPEVEDIKPAPSKKKPLLDFPRPFNYIFIAFGFVLIFGLAIAAIIYFTSDKYKLFKANQAYESGEYTKAVFLYEELISKNNYDIELQEKYGEALRGKGDLDNYTALLISIFDNSGSTLEQRYTALEKLIDIYDASGEFENIQKLVLATKDDTIIKRYSMYFVDPPRIVTEEGKYELPQLLVIESDDDAAIYYTITCTKENNTTVVADNVAYTGPVLLDEGVFNITAYSQNEKGVKSDEITGQIEIRVLPPVAPVVIPASGEYFDSQLIEIDNYSDGKLSYYYTTNGTTPNAASNKYTEPIVMLPGVSWYKFICIDERGLTSDIVDVRYVFDIDYNYTVEQAHDLVLNYLFRKGITSSPDGSLKDGGMIGMRLTEIISEDIDESDEEYEAYYNAKNEEDVIPEDGETVKPLRKKHKYVFEEFMFNENGKLTGLDTKYSVDVITGEVEKVE